MAKKTKLRKNLAAALVTTSLVVGVGGFVSWKLYSGRVHPAKLMTQARADVAKGDWIAAGKALGRIGNRMETDPEYLTLMLDAKNRQTSFKDSGLQEVAAWLDRTLATLPRNEGILSSYLKFQFTKLEAFGPTVLNPNEVRQVRDAAERLVEADPKSELGLRGVAFVKALPIFEQNTAAASTDVEKTVDELRAMADAAPDHADVLMYYVYANDRLRTVLAREQALPMTGGSPRLKQMGEDLDARVTVLLKSAADESRPALFRGVAYARAYRIDQLIAMARLIDDKERLVAIVQRALASLANAAQLMPPGSDLYLPIRSEQSTVLAAGDKAAEAEAMLRESAKVDPLPWQPRLLLADFLADRDRAVEGLEVLSVDLQPSTELTGLRGYQFFIDDRQVPMRRAMIRLQALAKLPADQRDAEITKAQAEYDTAVANNGSNFAVAPQVLQVRAGLQEVRNDRTGALQTLNRALESSPPDRLRLRILQQLVTLNLALNQPGAAAITLEQQIRLESDMQRQRGLQPVPNVQSAMRLIDLRLKNNELDQARVLLEQAKRASPGNPALLALEIRLLPDPEQKRKALEKFPEDTPQNRLFKLRFAGEIGDDATVRRLADVALKAEPGAVDTSIAFGDYLRKNNKRDEALAVFKTALEKHPEDKGLALLVKDTETTDPTERGDMIADLIKDPYQRAMIEADQLRMKGDYEGYKAKLIDAEPLDNTGAGDATERLYLYHLANNDPASAEVALNRLATSKKDPALLRAHRVRLSLAKRSLDEAATQADALIADLPNFSPGWVMKGQVHQARGQLDQAVSAFETALGGQPDNTEALRGLIESGSQVGRQDLVKRAIDTGLRATKGDEYFTDASLRYQLAYGDPTQTVAARLKQRDAKPDEPGGWLALAQSYAASAADREKKNDATGAADYRKKTLELFRAAMAKFPDSSGFTLEAANQLFANGDAEGAFKLIDGMNANPKFADDVQVQAQRVDFYATHGKADVAQQLLEGLVQGGKATDQMKASFASYQVNKGDVDGALTTLAGVKDAPQVREMRMNILLGAKRLDEASKLVTDALAVERSVPNLLMAALVAAQQGKVADGLKLADEAVAANADNPAARFTRVRLMLAERPVRNNDVIADLQVVRKNQPANVEARLILVDRLQATDRSNEALLELESIQREAPGNLDAATKLVQAYLAERPVRLSRIEQVLADAKKQGLDKSPRLLSMESAIAAQNKDWPRAVDAARRAAAASPDDIALYRAFLGTMLNAGAHKEVLGELDRIQEANASTYWLYLTRGIAQHRLKQEEMAAQQFDRAMGIATSLKDNAVPINEIANTYATEYGADEAAKWLKAKLPDGPGTQLMLMGLFTNAGKVDRAVAAGEALLPTLNQLPAAVQAQVLTNLGAAYLAVNPPRPADAREMFFKLDRLEPNNMMTLNNLAYAMTLEGSGSTLQEALEYARRANELSVKNASPNVFIMDTYGWTLVQSNQVDEGLRVLRQAADLQRLPEVDYHIGEALIVKQAKVEALQSLQNALANVTKAKQNGTGVDPSLEMRINDAIRRAQLITAAP